MVMAPDEGGRSGPPRMPACVQQTGTYHYFMDISETDVRPRLRTAATAAAAVSGRR
jgi:hypothetical protein